MNEVAEQSNCLTPISEEQPQGVDIRTDEAVLPLYYQLRDARKLARSNERARMQEGESSFILASEWQTVAQLATDILSTKSKDIEVACYLIEAMTRMDGFQGLDEGLRLLHDLVQDYWPTLYPSLDEDDPETEQNTFIAVTSLNGEHQDGTLIMPIKAIAITQNGQDNYATWQYEQAMETAKSKDPQKPAGQQTDGADLANIKLAADQTPASFYQTLINAIQACQQSLAQLTELLTNTCATNAPPTHLLRKTLDECLHIVNTLSAKKDDANQAMVPTDTDIAQTSNATAAPPTLHHEGFDRELLLQQIQEIADRFRRYEPHSPISYGLEQVISWAHMSLPELTQNLIDEPNAFYKYCRITGVTALTPPEQPSFAQAENPEPAYEEADLNPFEDH